MDKLFERERNKFPQLKENWDRYAGFYNRIEVPAKTVLLEEGEISKRAFFIEQGCLRVWFIG